ncbi:TIGR01777 family oxidoreductase [Frigoribacterium sp. CFBP 13712]|uniref:TIGR01777 family oxidoreductase n=1 Tax=Frigoribacterium sp. CFBP 13712 TaxID=2775309 RepID=UPI00177CE4CB|nr:TIGR01777 family oxidoreductase [Frigoribacterium sp. CFBP 13712]MBD8703290.1 TIGR01777 family protein [Frigoribacterium sp. CFBP 13712]
MNDAPRTVLIAGASGLIGTELSTQLRAAGHTVLSLVRGEPRDDTQFTWIPSAGVVDTTLFDRADVVVNLSGASLGRLPWTRGYKREIVGSRVDATRTLVAGMRAASTPPTVLLSGSAVGIYGDRPGDRLTESSPRGTGFLSDVVAEWERTALTAPDGVRVALMRTGLVVGPGGALAPLLPLTRFGLGSRLGTGDQFWPWISLHDEAAAFVHVMASDLDGPINLAGPTPATSDALTRRLAHDLSKPYALTVPEFVISTAMQEAGRELLLPSQQVVPEKLLADGFVFRHRTVDEAVDALAAGL